jgi:hypothetical protein
MTANTGSDRKGSVISNNIIDTYQSGGKPIIVIEGTDVIIDGCYISRHIPLGYKWRSFKLRTRWKVKRLLRGES